LPQDFSAIIPGHGGVFDRIDCQLIMGLFTFTYYSTFVQNGGA
jgi:phosphatidate cytidylyltransferase